MSCIKLTHATHLHTLRQEQTRWLACVLCNITVSFRLLCHSFPHVTTHSLPAQEYTHDTGAKRSFRLECNVEAARTHHAGSQK
jgi:hypothetical protein